ncbi:MAG: hypothetical protein JXR70_12810 [Spirochaetales bacterium]|nr:hypothetical protein [Spirochaetales bacterium]
MDYKQSQFHLQVNLKTERATRQGLKAGKLFFQKKFANKKAAFSATFLVGAKRSAAKPGLPADKKQVTPFRVPFGQSQKNLR